MKNKELTPGDIVQISPDAENEIFRGCLVVVSEPKGFGCQGYVQIPGKGQAYVRLRFEEIELVGKAMFIVE